MSDRLNYNTLAPAAMKALGGVHVYLHSQADLPKNLIDLAYLRTSQINGCAYCIDMHSHDLIAQGVPVSKLLLVSAWHEAGDIFDMRERGVLAWTETVTDVARTGVPDDAYAAALAIFSEKELADLTVAVGVMGAYNRLAISFHQRPAARKGEYPPTLLQGRFRAVSVENLLPMLTTFDQDVESR